MWIEDKMLGNTLFAISLIGGAMMLTGVILKLNGAVASWWWVGGPLLGVWIVAGLDVWRQWRDPENWR